MDKIQRQREHFNRVAGRYRSARKDTNHLLLKSLIWSDFLEPHSKLKKQGLSVLEAMCGFADGKSIIETALEISTDYSGFDYSDEVIATLKNDQPEIKVFHADAGSVELTKEYDLILLLGGLHHVPHIAEDVVARLAKAIKPGGYFINLEPTNGNALFSWIRRKIYQRNSLFDEKTERAFDVLELESFFTGAGLRSIDTTYPGLSAYVLYYNPDAFPWLNLGGEWMVKSAFRLDTLFSRNIVGRKLSFATLSLWQKDL
ncbi:MAG: methyltransferase domain-containing protein [Motiliproteus sp.]